MTPSPTQSSQGASKTPGKTGPSPGGASSHPSPPAHPPSPHGPLTPPPSGAPETRCHCLKKAFLDHGPNVPPPGHYVSLCHTRAMAAGTLARRAGPGMAGAEGGAGGGWVGEWVRAGRQGGVGGCVGGLDRLLPAEPEAWRVLHPPPHPVLDPPPCKDPQGRLPGARAAGAWVGVGVLVRGGEPASAWVSAVPQPPGCPVAPPCGHSGDGGCLIPARRASSPSLHRGRRRPPGSVPPLLGPRRGCSGCYKTCLHPSPSAAPASPPAPSPEGHQQAGLPCSLCAMISVHVEVSPPIHIEVLNPAPQNVA